MNKSEFIKALAVHYDGNRAEAAKAVNSFVESIAREVAKGEKVAITGFGTFEKSVRPTRMARNPRTGERVRVKRTAVPKFRAGAELKAVVASTRSSPARKTNGGTGDGGALSRPPAPRRTRPSKPATKKTVAKRSGGTGDGGALSKPTTAKRTRTRKPAKKRPATRRTVGTRDSGALRRV